jgi:phenylacetate-CoA ligase
LHIASDFVITELVEVETGRPVEPGQPGEIVYTNLIGDTQPLLRYRTRDVARLATDGACACGFTGSRLRDAIEGRVDDMIWLRGVNVFPSAVEAVVRSFAELAGEYELVVEGARATPSLLVRAELRPGIAGDAWRILGDRVREALSTAIRVSARLELVTPGALPRAEAGRKARRVVDKRE